MLLDLVHLTHELGTFKEIISMLLQWDLKRSALGLDRGCEARIVLLDYFRRTSGGLR